MQAPRTPIEQVGRIATFLRESVPFMQVAVEDEPGHPNCVRVYLAQATWDAVKSDRKATNLYYDTVLDFPSGLQPLFGQDYRQAVRRHRGELPSQAWHADL